MTDREFVEAEIAKPYMDFDGPCWCNKRMNGPHERNGHNESCKRKKVMWEQLMGAAE